MELIKHAKSVSDNIKSLYVLIGCYAVLAIFIFIQVAFLSSGKIVNQEPPEEIYFDLSQLPPSTQEEVTFLQPTPPPPPVDDFNDIPVIVDNDSINKRDTIIENEAEFETEVTGNNTDSESTNGESNGGINGDGESGNIYFIVDKMPEYPGGDFGLRKYIAENIKYPPQAHKSGIKGIVYIKFCVTSAGVVEKAEIVRPVHPLLDQEALRVVTSLPKWTPGERKGRKVNVWYSVPISFQLN